MKLKTLLELSFAEMISLIAILLLVTILGGTIITTVAVLTAASGHPESSTEIFLTGGSYLIVGVGIFTYKRMNKDLSFRKQKAKTTDEVSQ